MNSPGSQENGVGLLNKRTSKKSVYISESSMNQYQSASKQYSNSGGGNSSSYQRKNSKSQSPKKVQETSTFLTGIEPYSSHRSSEDYSPTQQQQISQQLLPSKGQSQPLLRLKLLKSEFDAPTYSNIERKPPLYIEIENKFSKHQSTQSNAPENCDSKWMEYKIIGRNIPSRSRSAITIIDGYLYVYGGYELTLGSISDFWRINLASDQYVWEKVRVKGKLNPGSRSRMTCESYKKNLYLFGGLSGSSTSTNEMWCFNLKQETWGQVQAQEQSEVPPSIDSHSSVVIGSKMYILFGYISETASVSNSVFEFDFERSTWKSLFDQAHASAAAAAAPSSVPKPRFESSITTLASSPDLIFAFGGTDGSNRMNDLWTFNIRTNLYSQIIAKNQEIPMIRSGHQIFSTDNHIVVFGGLHDITWELDDLHAFDVKSNTWIVVHADTARKREKNPPSVSPDSKQGSDAKSFQNRQKKRVSTMAHSSPLRRMNSFSPRKSQVRGNLNASTIIGSGTGQLDRDSSVFENESRSSVSPTLPNPTKLAEKRRKEFLIRKANMLQAFEVMNPTEQKYRDLSPTSQAMKDSLLAVGNPMPSLRVKAGRLTDFGRISVSRFLLPLTENGNTRQGKRPCARDGHRVATLSDGRLIFFGGDRHNMSFHDIYQLNLKELQNDIGLLNSINTVGNGNHNGQEKSNNNGINKQI